MEKGRLVNDPALPSHAQASGDPRVLPRRRTGVSLSQAPEGKGGRDLKIQDPG